MAFEWIPIEVGEKIRKAHIDELRDNIDYIIDNLANVNHNDGAKNTFNDGEKTDEYVTFKGTHNISNDGDHRITEYSTQYSTVEDGHDNTIESGHDTTHDGGDVSGVFGLANNNAT